jgi:hypothetical protein
MPPEEFLGIGAGSTAATPIVSGLQRLVGGCSRRKARPWPIGARLFTARISRGREKQARSVGARRAQHSRPRVFQNLGVVKDFIDVDLPT